MATRKNKKPAQSRSAFATRFSRLVKEAQRREASGKYDAADDVLDFVGVSLNGNEKPLLDVVLNIVGEKFDQGEDAEFSLKDLQDRYYMRYGKSIDTNEAKHDVEHMSSVRIAVPQEGYTVHSYLLPIESADVDEVTTLYTVSGRPVILDVTIPKDDPEPEEDTAETPTQESTFDEFGNVTAE